MTLQKLLLKLSKSGYYINCLCSNGKLDIDIQEWYTFNSIRKVEIDLNEKIDISKFSTFIK